MTLSATIPITEASVHENDEKRRRKTGYPRELTSQRSTRGEKKLHSITYHFLYELREVVGHPRVVLNHAGVVAAAFERLNGPAGICTLL